jgi:hypothetical protein
MCCCLSWVFCDNNGLPRIPNFSYHRYMYEESLKLEVLSLQMCGQWWWMIILSSWKQQTRLSLWSIWFCLKLQNHSGKVQWFIDPDFFLWYLVRIIIRFWGWLCVLWTKLPIDVWQFIMGATKKRIEGVTLLWWWRFLENWRSSQYIYAHIVAANILYWKPKVLRGSRACATRWNLLGEGWR